MPGYCPKINFFRWRFPAIDLLWTTFFRVRVASSFSFDQSIELRDDVAH
jgi:hypothetical protein